MNISVSSINLQNFKGIKKLDIELGQNTSIFGENATGKTTIFDAFLWCLFGKDSMNKADFEIKSLDEKGNAAQNIEHSVDVSLMVDGKSHLITKTLREVWTKKRGSTTKEFTGNTIDYFINGVPLQKKEFDARIATIIDENIFRLLTDPRRFNEHTPWQDRRKLLMEICGQVDNAEVIKSDKKLAGLTALLNGNNIDDFKKIIASQKKEINEQIEKIPVRIDEATRSMVEIRADIAQVPTMIKSLEEKKSTLESQLADLSNGGGLSKKRIELADIEAKIQNQKTAHDIDKSNRIKTRQKELDGLEVDARAIRTVRADLEASLAGKQKTIDDLGKEIVTLRATWATVDEQTFSDPTTCPTCGQALPEIAIKEAQEKFNQSKATKLAGINEKGKELKDYQATMLELMAGVATKIKDLAVPDTSRVDALNAEIAAINAEQPDLKNLEAIRASIQAEIDNIQATERDSLLAAEDQILRVKVEIGNLQLDLNKVTTNDSAKKRIAELEAQQAALGKQYEEIEGNLFLVESFIRTKVGFLEKRINDKFSLARFKLFADQINGGLTEVCETTLNGVPYSSINNAGRIQAGMDIIKTLQAHYGITAPVWVDNRESIIDLPKMDGQTISLIVSESDKTLRVAA
jgi:DNA repair exonuclease SbcCD ATPase subunit